MVGYLFWVTSKIKMAQKHTRPTQTHTHNNNNNNSNNKQERTKKRFL